MASNNTSMHGLLTYKKRKYITHDYYLRYDAINKSPDYGVIMNETRQRHADQRGVRIASLWKRLKGTILRWDAFWVSKARKHNLPAWIGHIPMSMLASIMLAALVFGGMVIASSAVLVGALVLLVSGVSSEENDTDSFNFSSDNSTSPHHFDEDEYVTNSILNNEYDGAPYGDEKD